jgi:hypothetical protein
MNMNYIHLPACRLTIGYCLQEDNSIEYAVTRVHPGDRYIKAVGRLAVKRKAKTVIPPEVVAEYAAANCNHVIHPKQVHKMVLDCEILLADSLVKNLVLRWMEP